MLDLRTSEDRFQYDLLRTPLGETESARVRYAAAMYFHKKHGLSETTLEVFRALSKQDHEDPIPVLAKLGRSNEIELEKTRGELG